MKALLAISHCIDWLNERVGRVTYWLVLAVVLISAGNATSRYALNLASNMWLELQWYLYSAIFLLCAGYTLLHDGHIRIDVLSSHFSRRTRAAIDIFGTVFFLLPMSVYIMWYSWPMYISAWGTGEVSQNAGGLLRWPARLLVPLGFLLLTAQGLSELIKRVAFLRGVIPEPPGMQADPRKRSAS